jgi:hypothetical protein
MSYGSLSSCALRLNTIYLFLCRMLASPSTTIVVSTASVAFCLGVNAVPLGAASEIRMATTLGALFAKCSATCVGCV